MPRGQAGQARKKGEGDGGSAAQKRAHGALPDAVRATKKSSTPVASGTTAEKGAADKDKLTTNRNLAQGKESNAVRTATSYFDMGWCAFEKHTDGSMQWIPRQIVAIGEDFHSQVGDGKVRTTLYKVPSTAIWLMDFEQPQLTGVAKCEFNTWEWENSKVACATLSIPYDSTKLMQGTQYPTCNLLMPQVYQMITKLEMTTMTYVHTSRKESITIDEALAKAVRPDMMKRILKARTQMVERLYKYFDSDLSESHRAKLYICTLLDPRFKNYKSWPTRKYVQNAPVMHSVYI
jgi:hypothetical protein